MFCYFECFVFSLFFISQLNVLTLVFGSAVVSHFSGHNSLPRDPVKYQRRQVCTALHREPPATTDQMKLLQGQDRGALASVVKAAQRVAAPQQCEPPASHATRAIRTSKLSKTKVCMVSNLAGGGEVLYDMCFVILSVLFSLCFSCPS